LGTRLVDRLPRHAIATKAGELLYDYARRLSALRDETETAMAQFLGKITGRLTLGGSTIPGGYLLPRWIGGFKQTYPDVQVTLLVSDTSEIMGRIIEGQLELGVVGAFSEDKLINQLPLVEDELRLVVPAGHKWSQRDRVSLKELTYEPFIMREHGSGTLKSMRQFLNSKGYDTGDFTIAAELGSTEAIRQGIKSNIGISILSPLAVEDDVESGHLHMLAVDELDMKRSFYLTMHNQRTLSPLSRAFIDYLKKILKLEE
jgi:DNA-binding transcriptional LysR family regulator